MMFYLLKYPILVLFFSSTVMVFAQDKNHKDIEKSTNTSEIARFLKANPNHEKAPELRAKLYQLVVANNDVEAKPKIEPLTKSKLKKEIKKDVKDGVNDKNKKTAAVLNHLFNNDVNKREAYVQIVNDSKCNLIVKFNGKNQFYNLDVPAGNQNFIMLDKGNYVVTTKICNSQYTAKKSINEDLSITLRLNGG